MGNSDELDAIRRRHEEEIKRIQAMSEDSANKEAEELAMKINFHIRKEDLENLAKKLHSNVSDNSIDNYY